MPLSGIKTRYVRHQLGRLSQGDILRDVTVVEPAPVDEGELPIRERTFPFVVLLTQDCDLEQDHASRARQPKVDDDKHLRSVLLCPAFQSQSLKEGTHLAGMDLKMQRLNRDQWALVTQNNNPRYHFLVDAPQFQLPAIAIDFKQYVTMPIDVVNRWSKESYVATVSALFREHLSVRFAQYLSRIGLPELPPEAATSQPIPATADA